MLDRIQAPIPLMLAGSVASLIFVAFAAFIASQTPWLGLTLSYDESLQLPLIEEVHSPINNVHLQVGDHLTSIGLENSSRSVSLNGFRLHVEPPSHATFSGHNALLE